MKVISSQKIPIKMWLEDMESGAIDQAKNLANFPFAFKHIAIMPDTHQGYGMPIGGVMATNGVVIPNAVGVDIGCGMCAVKTAITDMTEHGLKELLGMIRKTIPVGFNKHKEGQNEKLMPSIDDHQKDCFMDEFEIVYQEFDNAILSLGTLGGGNHFIEIQKGSDGHIWIMIHSGSRNLGYKVANYYNKVAKELNQKWSSKVPPSWDLAFLPLDSEEGKAYLREMNYCVEFALANRKLMMEKIKQCLKDILGRGIEFEDMINIAHNYAAMENHFGKNVMIHRKGATKATEGLIGIIPGSQGTKSYIVKGKGNKESFESCSHGAGRTMSRSRAKDELSLKKEVEILDSQGIIHGMRNKSDLDEAPSAYKDIQVVMENQKDLVDILVELTPLAVIKG